MDKEAAISTIATRMLDIVTINMVVVVDIIEVAVKRGAVRTITEAKIVIHSKTTHASFISIVSWHLVMAGSSR